MVNQGDTAPDFELAGAGGEIIRLGDLKGKPVVVYFYPKDGTSGCTREAIAFRDLHAGFASLGVEIIGISPDSAASHDKFKAKHKLNIQLAADIEKTTARSYGVWVKKYMYGRQYMGVERSTFLIGADGKIAQVWRKVRVAGHAKEVFAYVQSLSG